MKLLSLAAAMCAVLPVLASAPISIGTPAGTMTVTPVADNAVRVRVAGEPTHDIPDIMYVDSDADPSVSVSRADGRVVISLAGLTVTYDSIADALTFADANGRQILSELPGSRSLTASSIDGEPTYAVRQAFLSPDDECIYGTGQFQDGYLDVRGLSRRLTQVNTQISMPVILSSKGYGVIWNNYGLTDFNPCSDTVSLVPVGNGGESVTVEVTTDHGNAQETRRNNTFAATIDAPEAGRYAILMDVGQSMARKHKVTIDDCVYVDVNNVWLPPTTSFIATLDAGSHRVEVEGVDGDRPTVAWRRVDGTTTWSSPVAQGIDYTVIAGGADDVIATYRDLTGPAPMMPLWGLGYIHCRERYHDQAELLDNAAEFRRRGIPIDMIVQDWQWWGKYGWNAMRFDEDRYPDPKQMVDRLHDDNIRLMVSVWSKIDQNSELGKQVADHGYYIPGTDWIDFFNPAAADFYWSNFSDRLLMPYGIDAWWQDATEPENDDLRGRRIAAGALPGEVYRNAYPLLVNRTVYEGLRRDDPGRRTMILTRCGFPGIQRYAAATWSGDVGNDYETLRRQIVGGLGLMASGLPWWTYDAGGFFRPSDQYTSPQYHEVFLRWLQTSTFLPLMRVHGYMSDTEPWRYGEQVDSISRKYIDLRYRLMPYIYSTAAQVSMHGGTMMRPLVFDFADDPKALAVDDEFMFGKSILVAPVLAPGAVKRSVYLPAGCKWYDYWTDRLYDGGTTVEVDAPIDIIPIFIKAGSILPMSEGRHYAADGADSKLIIKVYPGADASFTLYEDEGDNYNCERGEYSTVPIDWDDAAGTLWLGARTGSYNGMPQSRLVIAEKPQGAQIRFTYSGRKGDHSFAW